MCKWRPLLLFATKGPIGEHNWLFLYKEVLVGWPNLLLHAPWFASSTSARLSKTLSRISSSFPSSMARSVENNTDGGRPPPIWSLFPSLAMLKFSGPINHSGQSSTTFTPSEVLSLDHPTKRQFLREKVEFFCTWCRYEKYHALKPALKKFLTLVIFFCIFIQNRNFCEKAIVELPLDCVYVLPRECGFKLHLFCTAKIFLWTFLLVSSSYWKGLWSKGEKQPWAIIVKLVLWFNVHFSLSWTLPCETAMLVSRS